MLNKKYIDEIFIRFSSKDPKPETELIYSNEFNLLVSIVLSAQATDISVNKATKPLFEVADTPEKMVDLGIDKLKDYIKSIGLYNVKASNIIKLSHILIEKYNGKIPHDFALLQTLPGVGRKTANVFLNCASNADTIAVDTHVYRISNRLGLSDAKNVLQCELSLVKNIPSKWKKNAHHWLILHGRYICKARKPLCKNCYLSDLCQYPDKNFS